MPVLKTEVPRFERGENTAQRVEAVVNYLNQLQDNLNYVLQLLQTNRDVGKALAKYVTIDESEAGIRLAVRDISDTLRAELKITADGLEAEVTRATDAESSLSSRITQNAEAITSEVTRAENAETALGSRITQTAEAITAEVTRATGAESGLSTRITQNAEAIALKASQTSVDSLTGRVTDAEAELTVQAANIASKVSQTEFDALEGRVDTAESSITQNANAITAEVTRATGAESGLSSRITQTASEISSEVTRAKNAESGLSTRITQNAEAIALKASQSSVDSLSGRVTAAESELTVQAGQIASKVSQTDYNGTTIASLINQSADTVQIQAKHVELNGYVTIGNMNDAFEERAAQSASGSIVTLENLAGGIPFKDITVSIVPRQSGSGTPSPSNVRAISGFTEATVTRAGKNLIPYPYANTTKTVNGITFTDNGDGTVTANGTATANATFDLTPPVTNSRIHLPAGRYTMSLGVEGGSSTTYLVNFALASEDKSSSKQVSEVIVDGGSVYSSEYTFDATGYPWMGRAYISVRSGYTCNNVVFKPMLRPASIIDATYEPPAVNTYEVSFGSAGTVYGGTLDVTTGKLTVDRKTALINSLTWTSGTASGRTYFKATPADKVMMGAAQDYPLVTSNIVYGGNYTVANMPNPSICQAPNSREFRIYDSAVSSVSDMLSKYGTGQVCYYLATPVEYNLTPAEITTLLGTNTLWADTGDISVEYENDVSGFATHAQLATSGATEIDGGNIKANTLDVHDINMYGDMTVNQSNGGAVGGTLGYMSGLTTDDSGQNPRTTNGMGLKSSDADHYLIVTTDGIRMTEKVSDTKTYDAYLANGLFVVKAGLRALQTARFYDTVQFDAGTYVKGAIYDMDQSNTSIRPWVIFENASPTSACAAGTIPPSSPTTGWTQDDINAFVANVKRYSFFYVEIRRSTSSAEKAGALIYVPSGGSAIARPCVSGVYNGYISEVFRDITINRSTGKITFGTGYDAAAQYSGGTSNNYAIPTLILGFNPQNRS